MSFQKINYLTFSSVAILLVTIVLGCGKQEAWTVNVYEVRDQMLYDTLGHQTDQRAILLTKLDSAMETGATRLGNYSWKRAEEGAQGIEQFELLLKSGEHVFDFSVYRAAGTIVFFGYPDGADYRLLKRMHCLNGNCEEQDFAALHQRIDSIRIPPMPYTSDSIVHAMDSLTITE